jgi:hypothetical protein
MRYRLRTLMIVLALAICFALADYCVVRYSRPVIDAAGDYLAAWLVDTAFPWMRPTSLQ